MWSSLFVLPDILANNRGLYRIFSLGVETSCFGGSIRIPVWWFYNEGIYLSEPQFSQRPLKIFSVLLWGWKISFVSSMVIQHPKRWWWLFVHLLENFDLALHPFILAPGVLRHLRLFMAILSRMKSGNSVIDFICLFSEVKKERSTYQAYKDSDTLRPGMPWNHKSCLLTMEHHVYLQT